MPKNSRTRIQINSNMDFHLRLISEKFNDKNFEELKKTPFWGHFWPFLAQKCTNENFRRKLSPTSFRKILHSCKKSVKKLTIRRFRENLNKHTDKKTSGHASRGSSK